MTPQEAAAVLGADESGTPWLHLPDRTAALAALPELEGVEVSALRLTIDAVVPGVGPWWPSVRLPAGVTQVSVSRGGPGAPGLEVQVSGAPTDAAALVRSLLPLAGPVAGTGTSGGAGVPAGPTLRQQLAQPREPAAPLLLDSPLPVEPASPASPGLDVATSNPVGRLGIVDLLAASTTARLELTAAGATLHVGTGSLDVLAEPGAVAAALRGVLAIAVQGRAVDGPDDDATVAVAPDLAALALATVASSGAVLSATALPEGLRHALGTALVGELLAPLPGPGARRAWEQRSIRQRREAMRGFGGRSVAPRGTPPAVSAVLVTKRPQNVDSALAALEASTYPALEVVLLLHGHDEVPADVRERAARSPLPVVLAAEPEATVFGAATARAHAMASGDLLAKVDDDDGYGPEHLWDLVLAHACSGADLVGKPPALIRLGALDRAVWSGRYPTERYTDFVSGGTMLLAAETLRAIGGWRPLPGGIDRAMLERVLGGGGLIYRTHGEGYVYVRHDVDHTWQVDATLFLAHSLAQWDDPAEDLAGS